MSERLLPQSLMHLGVKIKRNLQQYQTAELGDLELGPFLN
jgi:hypothetical protein